MDSTNLVKMANRIGDFFQGMPDQQEARQGIVTHLRKYWEPRMRRALLAHVDTAQGEGLHDLVKQAVVQARATLDPNKHLDVQGHQGG